MRIKCVASINDATFKLPRLAVDRLKAVFLVLTELVKKDAFGRFADFKVSQFDIKL